jgi:hypothetical protein
LTGELASVVTEQEFGLHVAVLLGLVLAPHHLLSASGLFRSRRSLLCKHRRSSTPGSACHPTTDRRRSRTPGLVRRCGDRNEEVQQSSSYWTMC